MDNHTRNLKVLLCPEPDSVQIRAFFHLLLHENSGCLELRCIGNKSTKSWKLRQTTLGFYNDVEAFVRDALANHGKRNVYVGLNPRMPEMLHAAPPNTLNPGEGGKTSDILQRRWFVLDIDTRKPNKRIASTQQELEQTLLLRDKIYDLLVDAGIPAIKGMSGNGGHILILTTGYSIEEHGKRNASQNDDLAVLLRAFAHTFNNEHAEIDTSVFDAPRIWKVYGTAAIKGGNTQERPWRIASLEMPERPPKPVDIISLFSVEIEQQREREAQGKLQKSTTSRNLKQNIVKNNKELSSDWMKAFKGDLTKLDAIGLFSNAGLYNQCIGVNKHSVTCPWDHEHSTSDSQSTVVLWTPEGKIPSFKCLHQSHQTKTIQEVLEWFTPESVNQFCNQNYQAQFPTKSSIQEPHTYQSSTSIIELESSTSSLPAFPMEVYPPTVQEIVKAFAKSVHASMDIAAVQALSVVSIALGPTWKINAKGFERPARLWTVIIAPPGSAKTPVLNAMMKPIGQREEFLKELWKREEVRWKELKDNEEPTGKEPVQSHVKVTDFNIDSLINALNFSPKGIILAIDEFRQLFGLLEQTHTGGKNHSRGSFLSMWSGESISVVRKTTEDLYVKEPYIIVCGGTQPDTISSLSLSQGDGMIQRFLWCHPSRAEKARGYGEELPLTIRKVWDSTIYEAFDTMHGTAQATPDAIAFGNEAIIHYNQLVLDMNEAGLSSFSAMYAKAPDHLHRLIACLHGMDCLFEGKAKEEVGLEVFERAYKLMEYFLAHSKHCITLAMSGRTEEATFKELRLQDQELFSALQSIIKLKGEQTLSTSEWNKMLNEHTQLKTNTRSLGKSFKRLSEIPLSGLQIERPDIRNKKAKLWKITPTKQ